VTAQFRQCKACHEWIEVEKVTKVGLGFLCESCKTQAEAVICPDCGSRMVLRETQKFRYANSGEPRKFWGCSRFPACRATHGAHPDGRPLGIPGDAATKKARMEAHDAFDSLWKSGRMTRHQAYRAMQDLMGMSVNEAHIGRFTREQCSKLVALVYQEYPPLVAELLEDGEADHRLIDDSLL